MLRQASSRNQRPKGFKVKHGLQICLLVAICIWLLYQVKHSHDKKTALIERSSNILRSNVGKKEDFFKFGRIFLPQTEETHKDVENDETQEEEEIEEDRDAKQEETIPEIEDKEAKDDGIDEHDQGKGNEEESEHPFESNEEEKNQTNDEDEENEHGEVDVFNQQEHEGSTQEAREENYKRDDASSAVALDDHATESETVALNIDGENANATKGVNNTKVDGINTEILEEKVSKSESLTNGTYEGTKNDGVRDIFGGKIDVNATKDTNVDLTDKLDDLVSKISVNETEQINDSYHNGTSFENKDDEGTRSTDQIEAHDNSTTSNATTYDSSVDLTKIQGISNDTRASNEDMGSLHNLQNITDVSATFISPTVVENSANNSTVAVDEQKSNSTMDPTENKTATAPYVNDFRNATQGNSDNSAPVGITEEKIDSHTSPIIQTEVAMASADEAAE